MTHCPCCGQTVLLSGPSEIGATIPMSRLERRAFEYLAKHFGVWTSREQLADLLYSDDVDGGPENDRTAVASVLKGLRKKLKGSGLAVGFVPGRGQGDRRLTWEAKPN